MCRLQKIQNEIEVEGFHTIFYYELGKDFSHSPEKHPYWEMVYVDKGSAVCIVNGNSYTLTQGQIVFHEPNEVHAHISDKKSANNLLVISFSAKGTAMDFLKKKSFTLDTASKNILHLFLCEFESAMGRLDVHFESSRIFEFSEFPFGSSQLLHCYLTELCLLLIRNSAILSTQIRVNEESRFMAGRSLTNMLQEYLQHNIYATVSIQDICSHFLIGKSQLCKIFKANMGVSPIHYYNHLKIDEAKRLLKDGDYSISEISDKLMYSSIHNFSRAFKKKTLLSPEAYRKSILM